MTSQGISLADLRISYCRASRCWRSNNLRLCLQICTELTKELNVFRSKNLGYERELAQLKHLIWFLKIRCLAEDYYINESLLLNEDDLESEDQVETFKATRHSISARGQTTTTRTNAASMATGEAGGWVIANGTSGIVESRQQRTAILTGRMPSVSSRQSSRATSSYRPLTTSLTATQTAFSRSTRPILKYSTYSFLSKPLYEYLYNAQTMTNKCPDYRQCLEYLHLVQNSSRKFTHKEKEEKKIKNKQQKDISLALLTDDDNEDQKALGAFWLISFGICYFNLRMNKQAEEYFKLALVINSKYLDSYTWLIKLYLRSNQPIKVLKTCQEGLANSRNAILYNWMARVQSLICDSYAANMSLRESLKYYPTNIEALANVGHFSFYGDKLEQSLKCFERINQLASNQLSSTNMGGPDEPLIGGNSTAELLNNLALCNFFCGHYHRVIPLFQRAFLSSPSKEVTSNIWYNVSFIPLSCGFRNLAISCLRLALKNDSQNEEAINNLGVLKYGQLINDSLNYDNRQEHWGASSPLVRQSSLSSTNEFEFKNASNDQQRQHQVLFDEAETHFNASMSQSKSIDDDISLMSFSQPEMLYNMAIVKRRRGQLLASVKYCKLYLENDPNNHIIRNLLQEIRQLISHDS